MATNYLINGRRNRTNSNPVSFGEGYSMPLIFKVGVNASPLPGNSAAGVANLLSPAPLNNAPAPVTDNNPTVGDTQAIGGVFVAKPNPITIALGTPAVLTYAAHGLVEGQLVLLSTSGALPTGLALNTFYAVTQATADTFNLTYQGTLVNAAGVQSGFHTISYKT